MHLHNQTPGLDRARGNLTKRTLNGALDGSLSGRELGVTRQALGTFNESVAAAKSDGQVTRGERKALHAQRRQVSHLIHNLRHNELGHRAAGPCLPGAGGHGHVGNAGHSHSPCAGPATPPPCGTLPGHSHPLPCGGPVTPLPCNGGHGSNAWDGIGGMGPGGTPGFNFGGSGSALPPAINQVNIRF